MKVLADRHHGGLYRSLQLLFDRLGAELYTPAGHAWWDQGYWRFGEVYGDDRLAGQYLMNWPDRAFDAEFPEHPARGVTLDEARSMSWDVVLATVQENEPGFARFASEVGARYAVHVGNTRQPVRWDLSPLILNATAEVAVDAGANIGEEFDSDGIFAFRRIRSHRRVGSFVNSMPLLPCWSYLDDARRIGTDFEFGVHGIAGPDGNIKPIELIAEMMAGYGWAWHDKVTGDGYGHVVHYWAALGRPLIGHASHYAGQKAAPLWEDGVTCIDLDRHPVAEAVQMMRDLDPAPMGEAIRARFDAMTDWQRDADAVGRLLGIGVPA